VKGFYVTTPIYYVNDRPHIGHAYSTVAADVLARFQSLRGRPTRFLTGTDEHGQKIERRAGEQGMTPQALVDGVAPAFREMAEQLGCRADDFIRTTERRHVERVHRLWRRLADAGDIYLGEYEGWYSVSSEAFLTEKELLPGNLDPISKKPVERVKEKSYFFRLSRFAEPLLAHFDAHPDFVQPKARMNEVRAFVAEGLRDLSISRTTFRWGVPVPDDPEHVVYVWLDALTNYMSALGGPPDGDDDPDAALYRRFWSPESEVVHLVGKDILRFHAVYWPAFLMSAGLPLPSTIWAHGWLTVDGVKMSKSLGNFIPPGPLVDAFGADVLRYYLMRDVGFGQDGDFSHHNLLARYHGDLGNGLGNLLNRMVASIVKKNLEGRVPPVHLGDGRPEDEALRETALRAAKEAAGHLDATAPHRALESIWELVGAANRYVDQTAPWALAKAGDDARLREVVYTTLEALRMAGLMLWPFMPRKADDLRAQLGLTPVTPREGLDLWPSVWGGLAPNTETAPGDPLFPRFDEARERRLLDELVPPAPPAGPAAEAAQGEAGKTGPAAPPRTSGSGASPGAPTGGDAGHPTAEDGAGVITIDDVAKVELRLGLVKTAEKVKKSKKLLRLTVDLGEDAPRQILAGIAEHYPAEDLVGKRVVVVANLAPRKMMGLESQGMVLAASAGGRLSVVTVGDDGAGPELPPGATVR
jgi:methionyl-tRNA synthetase